MRNKLIKGILTAVLLILTTGIAFAVMPPKHYKELAEESKIKATAGVISIKVIESTKRSTYKEVTFQLIKSYSVVKTPEKFVGKCNSVDFPWQDPGVGGTIYYYPERSDNVFVTISENGGSITSYTILTPQLEEALEKDQIAFGMGKIYIAEE